MSIKPRLSKKYIGFIVIFPLLIVTSLVNIECPVCQADGLVSSTPGMENVVVLDVKSEKSYGWEGLDAEMLEMIVMAEISTGDLYIYNVTLTVVNKGPDDMEGYVKLVLVDVTQDEVLFEKYGVLEIPGETSLDVPYYFLCESITDVFRLPTKFYAEAVSEDVPDVTCDGTGKVPLNNWLLVNGFKDRLLELGGEGVQYETGMVFD